MSRFSIIDGSGLLFRSYYGFPDLSDDYATNTNMIYGFARMMLKLLNEQPEYLAIARDVGGKTARHEMDENYKANRTAAPDDLVRQLRLSHQLATDLRVPAFGYPWYEADDVLATRVEKVKDVPWLYTTVVSSDKDLKQLIGERIDIFDPMKNKRTDQFIFAKEFGFAPAQMADYLALIGDVSDNIPGVAGIWPKTATDLIKQFGTVEDIYNNIENIKKPIQEKLITWRESAFASKELVNLITVPEMNLLDISEAKLEINFDIMRHVLLDTYQFHSLVKMIDDLEKKFSKPVMQGLFG